MRIIESSAPGKLVLLGEYAVLFGHAAVVLAVNRRAHVALRFAEGELWSVSAPGFEEKGAGFSLDRAHGFRWRDPESEAARRLVLTEKVIGSLLASNLVHPEGLAPASVTLDTREFFYTGDNGAAKLGLGSSAALTVALTQTLQAWSSGDKSSSTVNLELLLDLHRSFQGGRGSGIDLAASVTGGVVEYRLVGNDRVPDAQTLDLPKGLHPVFLWTGRSASTADFLACLDHGMREDRGEIAGALAELGRISADAIANLRAGEIAGFLAGVNDFCDAMERLGHAAGIPILSDEHVELRRLARRFGVSYKPSGAGGGDVGIAFTDDPELAVVFAGKAASAGFPPLDLRIDPNGAEVQ